VSKYSSKLCENASTRDAISFVLEENGEKRSHPAMPEVVVAEQLLRQAQQSVLGAILKLGPAMAPTNPLEIALAARIARGRVLDETAEGSASSSVMLAALASLSLSGQAVATVGRRVQDPGMHRRVWLSVHIHGISTQPGDLIVLSQHLDTSSYMDVDELRAM